MDFFSGSAEEPRAGGPREAEAVLVRHLRLRCLGESQPGELTSFPADPKAFSGLFNY